MVGTQPVSRLARLPHPYLVYWSSARRRHRSWHPQRHPCELCAHVPRPNSCSRLVAHSASAPHSHRRRSRRAARPPESHITPHPRWGMGTRLNQQLDLLARQRSATTNRLHIHGGDSHRDGSLSHTTQCGGLFSTCTCTYLLRREEVSLLLPGHH